MSINFNVKKFSCIRIGHRHNVICASIMTCDGQPLHWVSEFRYLGVFIVSSRSFKCSLVYAKRSFYAAVSGLFGKLLNLAFEEVILELLRTKCTPNFIIPIRVFSAGQGGPAFLRLHLHRLCMKLFKTGSIDVVKDCQRYFAIDLPSSHLKRRQDKFILQHVSTVNGFYQFCKKL